MIRAAVAVGLAAALAAGGCGDDPSFCAAARDVARHGSYGVSYYSSGGPADPGELNRAMADFERAQQQSRDAFRRLREQAPPEIAADVATLEQGADALTRLDPSALRPEIGAAATRVDRYLREHCGTGLPGR